MADGEALGPPPPPWEREQSTRRRRTMTLLAALVVLVLSIGALLAGDGGKPGPDESGVPGGTASPRPDVRDPGEPQPVDPSALTGSDAAFGVLLNDIDAAERAMLAFQDGVSQAVATADDEEELVGAVRGVARVGLGDLAEIRSALVVDIVDYAGVVVVRDLYVAHLDVWMDYIEAIEGDPVILGGGPEHDSHIVAIDTTGYAFARTLREELPQDADGAVRALAEGILDRGFPDVDGNDGATV